MAKPENISPLPEVLNKPIEKFTISLNSGEDSPWTLFYGLQDENAPQSPRELKKSRFSKIPATVPGNVEIDLPAVSGNSGKTIDVLHKTTGNDCIIDPSGVETINGSSASITMTGVAYQNTTLICDGAEWYIR